MSYVSETDKIAVSGEFTIDVNGDIYVDCDWRASADVLLNLRKYAATWESPEEAEIIASELADDLDIDEDLTEVSIYVESTDTEADRRSLRSLKEANRKLYAEIIDRITDDAWKQIDAEYASHNA